MLKIYFSGSIRGGKEYVSLYLEIIKHLSKYGDVLTEHVGNKNIEKNEFGVKDEEIYSTDMGFLKESDIFIADVSVPSLGVGYEIAMAENMGKRILCLYYNNRNNKRLSAMINGNKNIVLAKYKNIEEAKKHIDNFFKLNSAL